MNENDPTLVNKGRPSITHNSRWISENSQMFNGNLKDFHERRNAFLQKQQENRENAAKLYAAQGCTFKPEINLTSEIICESDPVRGNEGLNERYDRLYQKDKKK